MKVENGQFKIHLLAGVIEWFKTQNGKYQSNINQALHEYIKDHLTHAE